MAKDREAFTMPPQIFRASHKRSYEALFLNEMINANAVPINPIGSHGKCSQCYLKTVYKSTGMSDKMIKIKV